MSKENEINFLQVNHNVKIPFPIKSEGYKIFRVFLFATRNQIKLDFMFRVKL